MMNSSNSNKAGKIEKTSRTNYWLVALEVFAIAACYLLVAWPLASATNVNVIFNGQTQATTELSASNLLNKQITSKHEPSDVTWTNVKILATISSASLSHTVEKIYLYKCKGKDPSACVMTEPQVFDKWIDTELSWQDVSEREGTGTYPQVANMLIIIKLTGPNGRTSWVGSWDTVKRTDYNVFNTYSHEISNLDFYAKSADLVLPTKSFIQGFQMIPFNWADKVVFQGAGSLYGLGGSESELQSSPPQLQSAQPSTNEIDTINKDFYFVLSETSSGTSVPVTLNLNPSFSCGDGICEIDLGETDDTCCYDCGCEAAEYCDAASEDLTGSCKNAAAIALQASPITTTAVTDCSVPYTASIKAKVNSPPSSLAETAAATVILDEDIYSSTCTKSSGPEYICPISMDPEIRCGSGTRQKSPNTINITLSYKDGANTVSKDISASFSALTVTYDCGCQDGYYCDSGETLCKPEGSIGLQILNVTSYMTNYDPSGDNIVINAKITNPPSDLTTTGTANYVLGALYKGNTMLINGTSGNAACTGGAAANHVYECSIPLSISGYDHESAYYIRGNSFSLSVSYSNGGTQVVKDLKALFSDITIPSYRCGDGVLNTEETEESCCLDAGCTGAGKYCDAVRGCVYINNVTMSIVSVQPKETEDCKRTNIINVTARVNNVPYQTQVNYVHYYKAGEMQNWGLQCSSPNDVTGLIYCQLQIPPIDGCELPSYTVGPNSLNFTMTFRNGLSEMITREISTSFDDIKIVPVYHCGQFGCETELGESGENCCIDCGCGDGEYCDYDMTYNPDGQCRARSGIRLVIDSPSAPVNYPSCEKAQKLEILAHIENEPSGVALEGWYGTINGESTERLVCRESSTRLRAVMNKSYQCDVIIPSIHECTKGSVHDYVNNTLSFFISYTDGLGRRATQTLTAPVQQVTLTQGIRSLFDITQEAIGAMQHQVNKAMDLMQELLGWMELCIDMMLFSTVALIIGTLVIGFAGDEIAPNQMGSSDATDRIKAMSQFSKFVTDAWGNLCEMISKSYEIQVKIIEAKMEMIQMQMCLDVIQHEIDSGNCENREESCFSQTASCLRFGEVSSAISDLSSYMQSMTNNAAQIAEGWDEVADAWEDVTGGGEGDAGFVAECEGNSATECCSTRPRATYYSTSGYSYCDENSFEIKLSPIDDCDYPVILQKEPGDDKEWKEARIGDNSYPMTLSALSLLGEYKFGYRCFDESEDYGRYKDRLEKNNEPLAPNKEMTVKLGKDMDKDCDCTDDNEGGLSASSMATSGAATVTGAVGSINTARQTITTIADNDFNQGTKTAVLAQLDNAIGEINQGNHASALVIIGDSSSGVIKTLTDAKVSLNSNTDKTRVDVAISALNTAKGQLSNPSAPPETGAFKACYYEEADAFIWLCQNDCTQDVTNELSEYDDEQQCNSIIQGYANDAANALGTSPETVTNGYKVIQPSGTNPVPTPAPVTQPSNQKPDLTIENLQWDGTKITFDLKNLGEKLPRGSNDGMSFNIKMYLGSETIPDFIWSISTTFWDDSVEDDRSFEKVPTMTGNYDIRIVVDEDNYVDESNENNNEATISVADSTTAQNQPPAATIDFIHIFSVSGHLDEILTPITGDLNGIVAISGTATDPDGLDDIASIRVRAKREDNNNYDLDEYTWADGSGYWNVAWDIESNSNVQDGDQYSIIVDVTDNSGEMNTPFHVFVTISKP